jgi:hypothetical protein
MEVCLEEMNVETIGALEDQSGDHRLALGCRNPLKRWTKNDDVRGIPKGRTFVNRRRAQPKCNTVIRDRGL